MIYELRRTHEANAGKPEQVWYWRIRSTKNGKILAHSETYARKTDAEHTMLSVANDDDVIVSVDDDR